MLPSSIMMLIMKDGGTSDNHGSMDNTGNNDSTIKNGEQEDGLPARMCWLKSNQIEAGRIAIQRVLKRDGKIFIRVFPDKPVAKKPLETRMGTGKADVDYWAARVRPGTIIYELAGVSESRAREAFSRVAMKMPVRCRFVGRRVTV